MKTLILLLLFLWKMIDAAFAQELEVKSMAYLADDYSAKQFERKDINGIPCALVKVVVNGDKAKFEGNVLGNVEYKSGEYWVYMSTGTTQIRILIPGGLPLHASFAKYGVNKVQSGKTYRMVINSSIGKEKLTIHGTPENAIVLIDLKPFTMQNGSVTAELPIGEHSYLVTADGYEPVNGTVVLNVGTPTKVRVDLISSSLQQLPLEQMYIQGKDYFSGSNGKERDIVKGFNMIKLAAEKGLADAQIMMGSIYAETDNVQQSRYWFQKAANQGNARAQYILGMSYSEEKDYKQALPWFRKAAYQGYAEAQDELGDCYALGLGIDESVSQAIYWYQKAAAQGNTDAIESLKIIMPKSK